VVGLGVADVLAGISYARSRLALANKESLVVGGALVRQSLTRPGQVVPVDSEHSAIAQALASGRHEKGLTSPVISGRSEVRRLVLTASGGPFRGRSRETLTGISAAAALNHPTWDMGPVVTINSSTLINKGLELIEAHLLFDVAPEQIDVVVHPQSIIHSMVEFTDGATIAQASPPDMRLPIALGLTWPERADLSGLVVPNDWREPVSWTFEPLDGEAFPAVDLARSAVAASATHPAVLNAANSGMLGCFAPGHRCIDNIIHAVAGPALRAECARYMTWAETFDPTRRQGGEPAGRAVFTGGYHLPAQHVIHSVGPIIEDGREPTLRDRRLLSSCYTSVLNVAHAAGLGSVGLCSLSTGVFGYPKRQAALVTLETIGRWLAAHPDSRLRIVISLNADVDVAAYEAALAPPPWRP